MSPVTRISVWYEQPKRFANGLESSTTAFIRHLLTAER